MSKAHWNKKAKGAVPMSRAAARPEVIERRSAGITPSQLLYQIEAVGGGFSEVEVKVPCQGCRACCYYPRLDVYPPLDDLRFLEVEQDGQGYVLKKREDGACVHLGEHGCTVYEHRPHGCRTYDCRLLGLAGHRQQFAPGQVTPLWEFPVKTRRDAVVWLAAHMWGERWVQKGLTGGDRLAQRGGVPTEVHMAAGLAEYLPQAEALYLKHDPPEPGQEVGPLFP
jgi:Fe-S-cluster containining protein